jgi:hypothetical protein
MQKHHLNWLSAPMQMPGFQQEAILHQWAESVKRLLAQERTDFLIPGG